MSRWAASLLLFFSLTARAQSADDQVTPPRALESPPAVMPPAAKAGGTVVLRVLVGVEGSVGSVDVVESGGVDLDAAAAAAVLKWHFAPAMRAGVAIPSRVKIPFVFEL